ncbi:adenine deaminase [Sesbania bispinosa]|nr:adenine deaminase [Sesbania bispinosa]
MVVLAEAVVDHGGSQGGFACCWGSRRGGVVTEVVASRWWVAECGCCWDYGGMLVMAVEGGSDLSLGLMGRGCKHKVGMTIHGGRLIAWMATGVGLVGGRRGWWKTLKGE